MATKRSRVFGTGLQPPTPASSTTEEGHSAQPMLTNLHVDEVPLGLQLRGITRGYRVGGSHLDCLWSLFAWHNQTLNAWTMIWGWFISCALYYHYQTLLQPKGPAALAFFSLWLSPTLHLPFTVGYHLLLPISPEILRAWRALDVIFIFVASILLTFSLAFFVLPAAGTAALTSLSTALAFHAWHHASRLKAGAEIKKSENTRYVMVTVLVYTAPMLWQAIIDLAAGQVTEAVGCTAAISFCLAYGAVVYVANFPEAFAPPGVFDHIGASQQLMHLSVTGAHIIEWMFIAHRYRVLHPVQ